MKLPKLFMILFFEESRKVSFGVWLFAVATALLCHNKLIDSTDWMMCAGLASGLVGGGTLADSWMKKKPDAPPSPAA